MMARKPRPSAERPPLEKSPENFEPKVESAPLYPETLLEEHRTIGGFAAFVERSLRDDPPGDITGGMPESHPSELVASVEAYINRPGMSAYDRLGFTPGNNEDDPRLAVETRVRDLVARYRKQLTI